MDDDLLDIVREQNRDMREMAKDLSLMGAQVARHDEQFKMRPQMIAETDDKIDALSRRIDALEASLRASDKENTKMFSVLKTPIATNGWWTPELAKYSIIAVCLIAVLLTFGDGAAKLISGALTDSLKTK